MEDPYETAEKKKRQNRLESEAKAAIHDTPFRPAQVQKSLKYDYPFLGRGETSPYTFLAAGDPYEVVREEKMRARWIEEAKLLYGDFVPSGSTKPIQSVTRSSLPDIVDVIKKLLLADWNDVNFVIGSKYTTFVSQLILFSIANPKDFIEVKFDTTTIDNLQGLHSYMNTLLGNNDDLQRY